MCNNQILQIQQQGTSMKVLGIGNAIVDAVCKVDENFLRTHNLQKSTMKLINENELKKQ